MRLGFFLGFIVGGAIASKLVRSHESAPDAVDAAEDAKDLAAAEARPVTGRIKHQVDVARDAAREAKLAKEAEMLRMYDDMVHRKTPSP